MQLLVNAIHERQLTGMALIDEVLVLANHGVQRIRQAGAEYVYAIFTCVSVELAHFAP